MKDDSGEHLASELLQLAKKGLRRRPESLQLPLLDSAAGVLSKYPTGSLERKLKDVLETAAGHLAEARRNAAAAVLDFGLEPGAAKHDARRLAASEALGLASAAAFKREQEKPLLEELATQLARLIAEHEESETAELPSGSMEEPATAPHEGADQDVPGGKVETTIARRPYVWIAATLAALTGIAGLVVLIANSHPGPSLQERELSRARKVGRERASANIPDDCAKTTADRFDPALHTHRLLASYQLYMYVPHQAAPGTRYGWAHLLEYHTRGIVHEVIHTSEAREFALSYHNYSQRQANEVVAIVALPPGSQLLPESVCLYRGGIYSQGTRYKSADLAEGGQPIGSYAPGASAYVTFWLTLPDVRHLGCGLSEVTFAGIVTAERVEEDWSGNASDVTLNFERRCHS